MNSKRMFTAFLCLNLTIVFLFGALLYRKHQSFHDALVREQNIKQEAYFLLLDYLDEVDLILRKMPYLEFSDVSDLHTRLDHMLDSTFHNLSALITENDVLTVFSSLPAFASFDEIEHSKEIAAALFHTRPEIFSLVDREGFVHQLTARMDGGTVNIWICTLEQSIIAAENNRNVRQQQLDEDSALEKAQVILETLGYENKYLFDTRIRDHQLIIDFVPKIDDQKQVLNGLRIRIALDNGRLTGFSHFSHKECMHENR